MQALTPLLVVAAALLAPAAQAQEAELLRCSEIGARDERLACYDALAAQAVAAKRKNESPAARVEAFGLESQPKKDQLDVVESSLDGIIEGWGPNHVFRLANGQIWQVVDDSSAVLYLKSPKVTVRRAVLGTFMLEIEGTKKTARVRRLAR